MAQQEKTDILLWYINFKSAEDLKKNLDLVRLCWAFGFGMGLFWIALVVGVLMPCRPA